LCVGPGVSPGIGSGVGYGVGAGVVTVCIISGVDCTVVVAGVGSWLAA
jgi:hypothetical protein